MDDISIPFAFFRSRFCWQVLQHALSSLEVFYDLGQGVSLYALKKAVQSAKAMNSAWVGFASAVASIFVGRLFECDGMSRVWLAKGICC